MGLFKETEEYIKTTIDKATEEICGHHHHTKVQLVFTTTLNNFQIRIMSLNIGANQTSTGTLGLVDNTSGNPVSATFSGVSAVTSDATIVTVTVNADNSLSVAGVAAGAATISVTATAAYTDANTGQPATSTQTIAVSVTVTAVVSPEGVTLVVNFSQPQIKK